MNQGNRILSVALCTTLCLSTLAGCKHNDVSATAPVVAASSSISASTPTASVAAIPLAASAPAAYVLPDANQLYELVAPIALFPDKLVAQVLAASAYPEQISAADAWLTQHPELKGSGLLQAVDQQPWDASIKSLTGFRSVLGQMASNASWTSALGEAYANDPTDVMNAIQVMRQRASANGALKSDGRQRVSTEPRAYAPPASGDASTSTAQGSLIVPPPQTIVIEPAQAGVVYVPVYNPTVVYGMPLPLYPGYIYAPPPYNAVATGLISFGVGVVVGAALENHYNWGWSAWGAHWGPGYAGGWVGHGPGIGYHHAPYVSHSTTIINHGTIVNHTTHVNGAGWDRPNFGHNVDRHLINTGPAHGSAWGNLRNGANLRPDFHQPLPTRPLDQRPASTQMHEPVARPANATGYPSHAAAIQANHPNFQPGLARPAASTPHTATAAPALASMRTAPFTNRGEGESRLGGFGFHGRR